MTFQGPETSGLEQRRAEEQIAREDALRTALDVLERGWLIERVRKVVLDEWHRDRNAAIAKIKGVLGDGGEADEAHADDAEICVDLLSLADVAVDYTTCAAWSEEQRKQASDWAAAVTLRASDNPVRVPPKPPHVPPSETEKRLALNEPDDAQH